MTAHGGVEEAVQAVKLGAYQFLTKPFVSNDAVVIVVAQAAEHKRLLDKTLASSSASRRRSSWAS